MVRQYSKVAILEQRYGIDRETWKRWRLGFINHRGEKIAPLLQKSIEWFYVSPKCILYDDELIESFIYNRSNPEEHLKNVEAYLRSLPSNQPKQQGRPAKTPINAA